MKSGFDPKVLAGYLAGSGLRELISAGAFYFSISFILLMSELP